MMGVSVGGDKGKAYMAVDLKVMDTNTGEIADARTVEATSESSGLQPARTLPWGVMMWALWLAARRMSARALNTGRSKKDRIHGDR